LDALTVHVREDQICVSIPLLVGAGEGWDYNSDMTNTLALSLFDLWEVPGILITGCVLLKAYGRHKKSEVESLGDGETLYFVEAQCGSDRPAWLLEMASSGEELFHFYNAMGLERQHQHVQSLLARCYLTKAIGKECGCLVAASFIRHIVSASRTLRFRRELCSFSDPQMEVTFDSAWTKLEQHQPSILREVDPYKPDALGTHLAKFDDDGLPLDI
jgi:hypothetical protein